jgi:hypothetical protein
MSDITPSVSTRIKDQLKVKIAALASVQKVYGYEEDNPAGFPAVFITAADMDGEFSSNAENRRLYNFSLLILFPVGSDYPSLPDGTNRYEYAEQVVATVIDEIINTMDTDFSLPNSDPTVLYVDAADVAWGAYNYEGGVAKAAQITLKVYTELPVQ